MRLRGLLIGTVLVCALLVPARAGEQKESKGVLETEPAGWIDLLPGKDLTSWKRVSIPPGSKLRAKSPWSVDAATGMLICDGVGIHEMLLYDKELADGI